MKKQRLSTLVVFLSILAVTALYQIWGITGNARGIAAAAVPEVAFAREQIHHVQLQAAASFPFYDGFESGVLGSAWSISTTNQAGYR